MAPETAAPDWSVTNPEIEPYVDCACHVQNGIEEKNAK